MTEPTSRPLSTLPKCASHPHTPLTTDGECPRCVLAAVLCPERPDTKHIPRPPSKKAHMAAQAHGRISAGKPRARRNVSAAEAARLGGAL